MAEFWNSAAAEPKRKFRWVLSLAGGASGLAIPAYIIKKVTKPTITVSEVKHSFINHSFYYPGRVEYNEIEFTLVDPVDLNAAEIMSAILLESGYEFPTGETEATAQTMTKAKSVGAMGEIKITQMDGNGTTVEEWTLTNAWIKEVSHGDLDYESDDLSEITVKLRYDWAAMTAGPST
jgi:hypothetical protein